MKTFRDLEFKRHPNERVVDEKFPEIIAHIFFPNGYGASVIQGPHFYTNNDSEYEVAVLKGDMTSWSICYDTPITDDVLGHLTHVQVTKVLKEIQELDDSNAKRI